MAKMKIAQAQKIVNDSRYGAEKKKEARRVLRDAKKAGKTKPKKKVKKLTRKKPKLAAKKKRAKAAVKSKRKNPTVPENLSKSM